jgi:nifR3 family TIM-barrel protein
MMRDPDRAERLVAAAAGAVDVPVTVKIRLGWDDLSRNAPDFARRCVAAGARAVTVHGRTRCQFYKGKADWSAIARVREAISIPLIANGDGNSVADAQAMLAQSGADGVMIGRGAYGRPWWPGVLAEGLEPGTGRAEPSLAEEARIVIEHHERMLSHHGSHHGNRTARKHIGWVIGRLAERGLLSTETASHWRATLLRLTDNDAVRQGLLKLFEIAQERAAA